jgi:hypothetical protein
VTTQTQGSPLREEPREIPDADPASETVACTEREYAGKRQSCDEPVWRLIVRLVLDVIKTREGRYEGSLTAPETGARHDFAGILELLAILEEQLGPEDIQHARPENGARP